MKAITLHQPWASLVCLGEKRFETRSWSTKHRGPLLIHASAMRWKIDPAMWNLTLFAHALRRHDVWSFEDLPFGALVGVADVDDCIDITTQAVYMDDQEFIFGGWEPGRYAWALKRPWRFPEPVPWAGKQGMWEVPDSISLTSSVLARNIALTALSTPAK